ncbi:hypothetical protein KKF61_08155 [Patescibacteria group bacterium]|nr:hypothetical protein [Patescibacteria group bacterium]
MGEPGVVKLFKDIKLNMPPLPTANETITITWKVDEESTYHTLTTVNSVNQHKWLPLQVRGKTLQLKLTYAAAGTNTNSPQLNSINISYANLGNRLSR